MPFMCMIFGHKFMKAKCHAKWSCPGHKSFPYYYLCSREGCLKIKDYDAV
jgi:hypothetical protein